MVKQGLSAGLVLSPKASCAHNKAFLAGYGWSSAIKQGRSCLHLAHIPALSISVSAYNMLSIGWKQTSGS